MPIRARLLISDPKIIIPFLCLGALIQSIIYGGSQSITLDEATTLLQSYRGYHQNTSNLFLDIHTLSYNFALEIWFCILKFDLFYLKLFSAFMAALSVGVTFLFVRANLGKKTALISALILAVSPLHVYFSQNGRAFAMYIATATLSSFCYLSLNRSPQLKRSLYYLISTYLMVCSHLVGFTLVAVQWIHFLFPALRSGNIKRIRFWLKLQAVLALSYLPIFFKILGRFNLAKDIPIIYSWVPKPVSGDLVNSFFYLSGSSIPLVLILSVMVAVVLGGVFYKIDGSSRDRRACISYLFLWLTIPMALLFIYSYLHHPIFLMRGFAPSMVPWIILASFALSSSRINTKFHVIILSLILFFSGLKTFHNIQLDQEGWRAVAQAIQTSDQQKTSYLIRPGYAALPFVYQMKRGCFFSEEYAACIKQNGIHEVDTVQDIKSLLIPNSKLWFVGYNVEREENRKIIEKIRQNPAVDFLTETEVPSVDLASFKLKVMPSQ